MKYFAILFLTLTLIGCESSSTAAPEVSPGLSQNQLVPTLQKIAETGEYSAVLQDLTVGLENAGYMEQAVTVQSFNDLSDPEDVKKLAAKLVETMKK
ncbi:hypothetical protein [Gimesia sp.]|uniref:hypothetical protein n=1 Tax=Gimesia sp. TaxID=2024833 RepID=UPI000C6BA9A5|nr:hypothetical protein [Gimesia sp.]MAX39839.1 hypothetical protein [Gimesia sp.]HBL44816.1 hypothetical protein [Planctomycetaceae bacterium]